MERNNKIEEMKNVLVDYAKQHSLCFSFEAYHTYAKCLYVAGYGNVEQARKETAKEITDSLLEYIGSNQQFFKIDDESVTLICVDKLFLFITKLAEEHGVEAV